ncbi:hypothetical protein PCANC_28714 [Puccinia coronata f. sp. avenae]|uniref:Uncharacterized protein n=1 Tax=Puccinia coronata f. sp. avenae TaxID=200324 RepID=A0A2N5RXB4_9BASI|nr:hypothetical protein PCANC_28714 [Puccinia coronata f. sp. avenae]
MLLFMYVILLENPCNSRPRGRGNNNNNEASPVDAGVTSVCVLPDGSLLAAGLLDTVVWLWDTLNGLLLNKLKGHKDLVYSVAFSTDGKFLVSGCIDKSLKLWDLSTLNWDGNPPFINTSLLAAAKNNKNHLLSQQSQQQQNANTTSSTSGAGGANTAASVSLASTIVEHGETITGDCNFIPSQPLTASTTTLTGHKVMHYVLSVAVSPDGAWIGSKIRGVQFWDPKITMAQLMLQGHKNLGKCSTGVSPQTLPPAAPPFLLLGLALGEQVDLLGKQVDLLGEQVNLLAKQVPAREKVNLLAKQLPAWRAG